MFRNLSVRGQLGTGFAAVVGLFVVTLLVIGFLLSSLTQGVRRVNERSMPLVLAVDMMDLSRSDVQQFLPCLKVSSMLSPSRGTTAPSSISLNAKTTALPAPILINHA